MDLAVALALIGAGILCYIIEMVNPGFFIAVPGTVLIIVGALGVFLPGLFDHTYAWLLIIVLAAVTAWATMRVYRRWAPPGRSTTTTSVDNIVGKRGVALTAIDEHAGDVRIEGESWRARAAPSVPAGDSIEVVGREGNLVLKVRSVPKK